MLQQKLVSKSASLLLTSTTFFYINIAQAQLTPDNTLGTENSIVTPQQLRDLIEGGAIRGDNLFHSFSEFNVNEGQQVYFANPQDITNIFTRVTGVNPSNIFGTLGVDGAANLILLNPNGISFGANAFLDVSGSFFATTAESIVFNNGWEFSAINPDAPPLLKVNLTPGLQLGTNAQAPISNEGELAVGAGQNLTLYGTQVTSTGDLIAPGGIVQVLGNEISLLGNPRIDVSSPTGGGNVLIGGGFQGQGAIPTAARTYIDSGVNINADAFTTGDGGTVIVWAEEVTGFYGNITARGGVVSGNGGLVEVSGKQHLIFRGNVDTSAVNGVAGTLLLDPINITIANGTGDETGDGADTFAGNNSGNPGSILSAPLSSFDDDAPVTIYESELEGLSGDTNIILQATNDITLQDLADDSLTLATGSGVIALSADADGDGMGSFVMEDVTDTIKTSGRDIAISGASLTLGSIDTSTTPIVSGGLLAVVDVDAGGAIPETGTEGTAIFTFSAPDIGEEIGDVDVRFSASHTSNFNLEASIQSPAGTVLELFNLFDVFTVASNGENFQDTLFDDSAEISLIENTAPFDGSFRPTIGDLAVFNGENAAGVWTLTINDEFEGDSGELYRSGDAAPWGTAIGTQLLFRTPVIVTGGDGGAISLSSTNGDISAFSLKTSGFDGASGAVTVDATGNISVSDGINTSGDFGDGGAISLNAINGDISAVSLNASGNNSSGGAVTLDAIGNITINDGINTSGDFGDGGAITLTADGNITATSLNASSMGESIANGGAVTLNAGGDIATTDINSSVSAELSVTGLVIGDLVVSAVGGEITIDAGGDIVTENLNSSADASADADVSAFAEIAGDTMAGDGGGVDDFNLEAYGGAINLISDGDISTNNIDSSAITDAFADASVYASAFAEIMGDLTVGDGGSVGDVQITAQGGAINLAADGDIFTNDMDSSADADAFADAGVLAFADAEIIGNLTVGDGGSVGDVQITARGGAISLAADGDISTNDMDSSANANANARANTLAFAFADAEIGNLTVGDGGSVGDVKITTQGGTISLATDGNISTNDINSSADTFASAVADASGTSAIPDVEITRNLTIGYGGNTGDLQITTQGGTISLATDGNISTNDINSSADAFAFAFAFADVGSSLAFTGVSAEIIRDLTVGGGGSVGDLQITIQGGAISLAAERNISTNNINSFANTTNTMASANAFAIADAEIGDLTIGDGGKIGDLQITIQGGAISLAADGNISTNNINSFAHADSTAEAFAFVDAEITGNLTVGDEGNVGDVQITTQGGEVNFYSLEIINTENIDSSANASVSANASTSISGLIGGNLIIGNAGQVRNVETLGQGGDLEIIAETESFSLNNNSLVSNVSSGDGDAGNIHISAASVNFTNTQINTTIAGQGNVGNITITAIDEINLDNSRLDASLILGAGNVGQKSNIALSANSINLTNFSLINATTFGAGDASDVNLNATEAISLTESSIFSLSTGAGNAGNINLNSGGIISISGNSVISTALALGSTGKGGDITLQAGEQVELVGTGAFFVDDAEISDSGLVLNEIENNLSNFEDEYLQQAQNLEAFFSLDFPNNENPNLEFSSQIPFATILGTTNGFDDDVYTFEVERVGTQVTFDIDKAQTSGELDLGLRLLDSQGEELASNSDAPITIGAGGSTNSQDPFLTYIFNQPGTYYIEVDGEDTSGFRIPPPEDYTLYVSRLDDFFPSSGISVQTRGVEAGGNITIDTPQLTLSNGTQISASTQGSGGAGSIFLNTDSLSLDNSLISSAVEEDAQVSVGNDVSLININTNDLNLTNNAQIVANTAGKGDAGSILIEDMQQLSLDNSLITTAIESGAIGQAGNITIQTAENGAEISLQNGSEVASSTAGIGNAGAVEITATQGRISLNNSTVSSAVTATGDGNAGQVNLSGDEIEVLNSQLTSTSSSNQGEDNNNAGSVSINAQQSINLDNSTASSAIEENARGNAGSVTLQAPVIFTANNSNLSSSTAGMGDAGNISVIAQNQVFLDQSSLSTAVNVTGIGNSGSVEVIAPIIDIINQGSISALSSGDGNAGSIKLEGEQLTIQESSEVAVSSTAQGNAGNLEVLAQTLLLDNSGQLRAETVSGDGGSITLENLNTLTVTDNSLISASTAQGQGGTLTVNATENINITNNSGLSSEATDGGIAGNLTVNTPQLMVSSNSQITVSSRDGQAGNLQITTDNLFLDQGRLTAETGTGQDGANLNLKITDFLFLNNGSLISATARNDASGGNINLDSGFIVAFPPQDGLGSDISANAQFGSGGLVTISTNGLFGIEFRAVNTPFNDITASSEFGAAGIVEILQPNVDPASSVTALSVDTVDASNLVVRSCQGTEEDLGRFVVTGRGGLPHSTSEPLIDEMPLDGWIALSGEGEDKAISFSFEPLPNIAENEIVEATGWIINAQGKVVLIADSSPQTLAQAHFAAYQCSGN